MNDFGDQLKVNGGGGKISRIFGNYLHCFKQ